MSVNIKNKVRLGTIFLFLLLALSGICSIYYLVTLKNVSKNILKNNYESLVYCRDMQVALDSMQYANNSSVDKFDETLQKEEKNLTEPGEKDAVVHLRTFFTKLQNGKITNLDYMVMKKDIQTILSLNLQAIERKNRLSEKSAESATTIIIVIVALTLIIGVTFAYNFPSVITDPIRKFTAAINEISNKNYRYKIHIDNHDEFGQLAALFNEMTNRLEGFESSNLNKLIFEKTRAEAVINSLKDASIGIDNTGRVLFANQQALQLLSLKQEKVVGRVVSEMVKENDLFDFLIKNESGSPFKIVLEGKENFYIKEVIEVGPADNANKVIVVKNITSFKELDLAKTNFIATISHELKTPLSSSDFSLKLLEDERVSHLTEDQKELVYQLKADNQRMLKILSELLNMSQAESGKLQLDIQSVDPYKMVDNSYKSVLNTAKEKHVNIQTQIEQDLPSIKADSDKTVWVLNNFLSNAIKFSPVDATITISVKRQEDLIAFSVTDNGPGIESKYINLIFDRYFQVPGRHDKKGSGIGLAICKDFIEAMNGKIWVESQTGKGSTFGFSLAVAKDV